MYFIPFQSKKTKSISNVLLFYTVLFDILTTLFLLSFSFLIHYIYSPSPLRFCRDLSWSMVRGYWTIAITIKIKSIKIFICSDKSVLPGILKLWMMSIWLLGEIIFLQKVFIHFMLRLIFSSDFLLFPQMIRILRKVKYIT